MRFIDPQHDIWHADLDNAQPPTTEFLLLSLAQWQAVRGTWPSGLPVGVVLPNDVDVETLTPDLSHFALVTLSFPKWTDGRAYSQARLLRTRLRFEGEIRATGEVLVDMLPLLQRTGFDAVELRADQQLVSAQRAMRFFAGHYQGDTLEPLPAFAREAVASLSGAVHVRH